LIQILTPSKAGLMAVAALAFSLLAFFYYEYVEEGAYDEFEANASSMNKNRVGSMDDDEEEKNESEEIKNEKADSDSDSTTNF
jgi:hypothetical protein